MRVLGIESTAHTFGVGIVASEDPVPGPTTPGTCEILANQRSMYVPPPEDEEGGTTGGIHPREAANHHAEVAAATLGEALDEADIGPEDLDGIAFSQGPGMGPSLRTGATVARALSLDWEVPLLGVNHCVAHLEIGRSLCQVDDPMLLYASGGNTQVIAYAEGRYRVFGETLDIGVGNFLDKFARGLGMPFPGGPEIEKLSLEGERLIDLPYSVKGMDVAFSGILTAAEARLEDHSVEDLCFSIQETVFAMLTEVTERALAHVGKDAVVMGGGVACNERLSEMVETMCKDRGASYHRPPKPVLVDNGAMIAWNGAVQLATGHHTPVSASSVDQRWRTDHVNAPWRTTTVTQGDPTRGAEAIIHMANGTVTKERVPKTYRMAELDDRLRGARTLSEARLLSEARAAGVATPIVLDVDPDGASLTMERVEGRRLRDILDDLGPRDRADALAALGQALGQLHEAGIAHGDPTTSNAFLAPDGRVVLIDLGLAHKTDEDEDLATDLHVLAEALEATHHNVPEGLDGVLEGYQPEGWMAILDTLEAVEARGRYRGT